MVESTDTVPVLRRRPWVAMGVAVTTAAVVVGGFSLANWLLPGNDPVPAGERITFSADAEIGTSVLLSEDGWVRDLDAQSDGHVLQRGPLELRVKSVPLSGETTTDQLWNGLGDTLRTRDLDVRLDEPSPITSDQGVEGITGAVLHGKSEAVAVLYPAPDGGSAAQLIMSGRDDSVDLQEAVNTIGESVAFTTHEEGE